MRRKGEERGTIYTLDLVYGNPNFLNPIALV
jgi:hypothetical protein